MCWNRAKKIHLISEKLILAVAKERFERTIAAAQAKPIPERGIWGGGYAPDERSEGRRIPAELGGRRGAATDG